MKRVAGMTIEGDRAALVVLARDGGAWKVERIAEFSLTVSAIRDWSDLECRVVIDAAAWGLPLGHCAYPLYLHGMGWDVRPPMWTADGGAANPSTAELSAATGSMPWVIGAEMNLGAQYRAYQLAAWGATHETTAEPPDRLQSVRDAIDRGAVRIPPAPIIGVDFQSDGAIATAYALRCATSKVWEHSEVAAAYGVEPEPVNGFAQALDAFHRLPWCERVDGCMGEPGHAGECRTAEEALRASEYAPAPSPDWRAIAERLAGAIRDLGYEHPALDEYEKAAGT